MTDAERALLDTLQDLEAEVSGAVRSARRPDVLSRVVRLRELTAALPLDADPLLRHCLERQSWEKARMILEGCKGEVRHGESGCA